MPLYCQVLVTPFLGGNATDIRRFFMPFANVNIIYGIILCYNLFGCAGCCRYVQGASLKAASRSEDGYEHPALSFVGGADFNPRSLHHARFSSFRFPD